MKCEKCGLELPEEAKFCLKCGLPVEGMTMRSDEAPGERSVSELLALKKWTGLG